MKRWLVLVVLLVALGFALIRVAMSVSTSDRKYAPQAFQFLKAIGLPHGGDTVDFNGDGIADIRRIYKNGKLRETLINKRGDEATEGGISWGPDGQAKTYDFMKVVGSTEAEVNGRAAWRNEVDSSLYRRQFGNRLWVYTTDYAPVFLDYDDSDADGMPDKTEYFENHLVVSMPSEETLALIAKIRAAFNLPAPKPAAVPKPAALKPAAPKQTASPAADTGSKTKFQHRACTEGDLPGTWELVSLNSKGGRVAESERPYETIIFRNDGFMRQASATKPINEMNQAIMNAMGSMKFTTQYAVNAEGVLSMTYPDYPGQAFDARCVYISTGKNDPSDVESPRSGDVLLAATDAQGNPGDVRTFRKTK